VEVVIVEGDIDMHVSPKFRDSLLNVFKKKARGVVVDLSGVPFMDSSAIATLVEGLRWSKKEGKRFILAGLQENVSHTLKLAKLSDFFEISPTQADALSRIG
jgi:anti-sigma B factor antagonist